MNCRETRERFEPLLDDALPEAEAGAVRAHLGSCEDCREGFQDLEATVMLLREIPRPAAPEGFSEGVLERIPRPGGKRGLLLRLLPAAAAAVLLVAVAIHSLRGDAPPEDPTEVAAVPEDDSRVAEGRWRGKDAEEGRPADVLPAEPPAPPASGPASMRRAWEGSAPEAAEPLGIAGKPGAVDRVGGPPDAPSGAPPAARRYLVRGAQPDAAAGRVLAELQALRDREGSLTTDFLEREMVGREEKVEADAQGEPARILLCLTAREMAYVVKVVNGIEGAVLKRINGEKAGRPQGPRSGASIPRGEASKEVRRMKVELHFAR